MRFKGIKQHDIRDCGAACLVTVFRYYGLKIPLVTVREFMRVDRNGASILAITETAKYYNMFADALQGTWEELTGSIDAGEFDLPVIAHTVREDSLSHFVVIHKIRKGKVYVFDPGKGRVIYPVNNFCELWTGYIVTFRKESGFEKANLQKRFFHKFFTIVTEQKKFFASVIALSLFLSGISVVSALVYQRIVDQFIMQGTSVVSQQTTFSVFDVYSGIQQQIDQLSSNINGIFAALMVLCFAQMAIYFLRGILLAKITKGSAEMLMFQYFSHMLLLPMRFFLDRETGEIMSRFQDIGEIQGIISNSILTLILDSFMLVAGSVVLISIEPMLFLLVLIIVGLYAIVVTAYRKALAKISREVMENDAVVTSKLKETIDGIETIKTMNRELPAFERLKEKTATLISKIYKGSIIGMSQSAILLVINGIGVTCVLWLGSWFVLEGNITLGSLFAFVTLIQVFITPAQRLIGLQPEIQQAVIAAERLNDILEVSKEKADFDLKTDKQCHPMPLKNCSIIFDNVSFAYGYREKVLKILSFEIKPKEKIAIVGHSGCGKTTVLHLIDAFYKATEGEILLGGMKISGLPVENIRDRIAYVSQNAILFTGSIKDNLLFGIQDIAEDALEEIIHCCCIDDILNDAPFGLDTPVHESGKNLSGGQQQRIAIARALLSNPDILLFDECTGQIDAPTENKIVDNIIKRYSDCTCIFVTHRKEIAERCDKSLFLKSGRVIGFDTHKSLMKENIEYRHFIEGRKN
jgi:ATP-binding cassette subfamily B protein